MLSDPAQRETYDASGGRPDGEGLEGWEGLAAYFRAASARVSADDLERSYLAECIC